MHSFKCIQLFPPLFCSPGGVFVRDLLVEDRRFISSWLNDKTSDGKLQVFLLVLLTFICANNRRIETILESLFEISRKFFIVRKELTIPARVPNTLTFKTRLSAKPLL